jgi:ABC-type sulfate/molybdate transport systems ATPase subunit
MAKVALARAYMKDAQVLILDEPTAALDARAEYMKFCQLTKGICSFDFTSFSTARLADRILVLENGTLRIWYAPKIIKTDGRYAELLIYKQEVINNKMIIFLKNLSLIKLINKHKLVEKNRKQNISYYSCTVSRSFASGY